jgi:hypothetical protein
MPGFSAFDRTLDPIINQDWIRTDMQNNAHYHITRMALT